jgi:hypothetical protein
VVDIKIILSNLIGLNRKDDIIKSIILVPQKATAQRFSTTECSQNLREYECCNQTSGTLGTLSETAGSVNICLSEDLKMLWGG